MAERNERVKVTVLNATFNNILVISWWSVLLVEKSGLPGENESKMTIRQIRVYKHYTEN